MSGTSTPGLLRMLLMLILLMLILLVLVLVVMLMLILVVSLRLLLDPGANELKAEEASRCKARPKALALRILRPRGTRTGSPPAAVVRRPGSCVCGVPRSGPFWHMQQLHAFAENNQLEQSI